MSTYGAGSAPSQNTINYDSILATSLFNYRKTLTDNISKSNPFFYKVQQNGMYEEEDGGVAIQINLMYALTQANTYSGYDVLDVQPTDGITAAFFDWRQMAVPISISRLEERQNASAHRIVELMKSKINQSEMGIKQFFNQVQIQGNLTNGAGNNGYDPYTNVSNGSLAVDPLSKLIAVDPTSASTQPTVGNINQSTASWWRNQTTTSALTSSNKPTDFLLEADHLYNNCAKGPGGPPDFILADQTTFELWRAAYYDKYRRTADSDNNYPFDNFKFNRAIVFWDEYMYDVYSNSTTMTYGAAFFINTKFCYIKYDKETNFINTPFQKPVDQDAKVAHVLWMGGTCISNRRKHGIWCKLPRTLTYS